MTKRLIIILLTGLLAVNCGSSKKASQPNKQTTSTTNKQVEHTDKTNKPLTKTPKKTKPRHKKPTKKARITNEQYIKAYATIAMYEMRKYNIPASITLAQGILESGSGNGRLAKKANNHFGIKCHDWKGKRIYHDDDERGECFRKYRKASESYKDHSIFLTTRRRYANLFQLDPYNYKAWARGLKKAGYATDPKYPKKLIRIIEKYKLYEYDEQVLGPKKRKKIYTPQEIYTYIVVKGDTLYGLAKRFNTSIEKIKAKNKLMSDEINIGQKLIIKN